MAPPYVAPLPTLLQPATFMGFIQDTPIPADHIGDRLLPYRDVASDQLTWQMVKASAPMAQFMSIGAESPRISDEQIAQGFAEIAKIGIKKALNAQDVRMLLTYGDAPLSPNEPLSAMRTAAQNNITHQFDRCLEAVRKRVEWARIQTARGLITVTATAAMPIGFSIDYGVSTQTASPLWSSVTTADPIYDIATWTKDLTYKVDEMLISKTVMWNLQRNSKIRSALYSTTITAGQPTAVPKDAIANYLSSEFGLRVTVYDAAYTTQSDAGPGGAITQTITRILPSNEAIFLPEGEYGFTATAPAPENDWATGEYGFYLDPNDTGRKDPWIYEVVAGIYALPVLTNPTKIIRATVG